MGKSKKLDTKLRLYYKGPVQRPTAVASVDEMQVIERALVECLPMRSTNSFKTTWLGQQVELQMVVGLSSCLRYLKRGQTKAMIFDDTATGHTSGFLIEFANKLNIPVIQASKLILVAPKVNLKTLLVVSFVDVISRHNESFYKDGDPRPAPVLCRKESKSFNELTRFLEGRIDRTADKYKFRLPLTVQVRSTGKSQAKKTAREGLKKSKRLQDAKTKQTEQKARGES